MRRKNNEFDISKNICQRDKSKYRRIEITLPCVAGNPTKSLRYFSPVKITLKAHKTFDE
jgi:hypothetical protein